MAVRVVLVHAGMRELLGDPGVAAYLLSKVEAVSATAKAIAPIGQPPQDKHPGEYMRSIAPSLHKESSGRVVGRVTAGTDHAFLVEARHGTLARALESARG